MKFILGRLLDVDDEEGVASTRRLVGLSRFSRPLLVATLKKSHHLRKNTNDVIVVYFTTKIHSII